ncbi:DUF4136 domain-containing protein [Sediminitomix flava]|uniref:Uncharacterized protein DUF4136 n=1 Tax=Sediminitomix flava TaxID=379075 RepID=A0A316A265_SEDFL|nr:DUF4136 domain-containing protein [Sediminitomix flava]PWJ43787.1 uncharacterized protein DUF4136 [Sediminitomix flava]
METKRLDLIKYFLISMLATLTLTSCENDTKYVSDLDTVITFYDSEYDYSERKTYSLPSEVLFFDVDEDGEDYSEPVDEKYASVILETIKDEMDKIGYTQVDSTDSPELVLTPYTYKTLHESYFNNWWGYWGWYPGWYPGFGPIWGPWYPYPIYSYYSYESGTVIIDMFDNRPAQYEEDKIPAVWSAAIRGLLYGSPSTSRIESTIQNAFMQSPYLGTESVSN